MNAAAKSRPNATRSDRRRAAAKRRRELLEAAKTSPNTGARPGRRRSPLVVAATILTALVIVAGLVVALVVIRDSEPDLPSLRAIKIANNAPEQVISTPPSSYRLGYKVETTSESSTLTEDLAVRRPFDMRYRIGDQGAMDTPLYDLVVTANRKREITDGRPAVAERATPDLIAYGVRFDVTLQDLIDAKFFVRRERRQILDTECTVYRTGAAIESGMVKKATATRFTDMCIADDGLVLEELAVASGVAELRVTVNSIERTVELTDVEFPVVDDVAALTEGGVELFDLAPGATPTANYWTWASVPAGWTHVSRQRAEITKLGTDETGPAATKTSWVDVYTRGIDVLVVRQGAVGNEPTVDTTEAISATFGALGEAKVVLGAVGHQGVVADAGGRFVHISGTISLGEFTSLAGSLQSRNASN